MSRGMAYVLMTLVACAFFVWLADTRGVMNASEFVLRTLGTFAIFWAIVGAYRLLRCRRE
jgi:hypothetical protein